MFATCAECGMKVIHGEYHPYTACVLYKHTRQAEKVESMIRAVALYGYEAAQNGVALDDALRNIAASNNASTRTAERSAAVIRRAAIEEVIKKEYEA